MDWKHVATRSDQEQMRAWVENWKRVGPELERMKKEKLRSMSEEEAFNQAEVLSTSAADEVWIEPARAAAAGLIEQQRLFHQNPRQ